MSLVTRRVGKRMPKSVNRWRNPLAGVVLAIATASSACAETLDLGIVVLGETTGFDVNGLLVQGGGSICASLDVAGAQIAVSDPNAGTLTANEALVCLDGETSISATPNNDSNVPAGYATVYVLTQGEGLVIGLKYKRPMKTEEKRKTKVTRFKEKSPLFRKLEMMGEGQEIHEAPFVITTNGEKNVVVG